MYRARLVLSKLAPIIPNAGEPERFGAWLLRNTKSSAAGGITWTQRKHYSASAEPFLNGSSTAYVEEMYNAWLADPKSVHVSWDAFFRSSSSGALPGQAYQGPPSLAPPRNNEVPLSGLLTAGGSLPGLGGSAVSERIIDDHLAVQAIIRSYQVRGHLVADLDPIEIKFGNGTLFYNRHGQPDPSVVRDYLIQIELDVSISCNEKASDCFMNFNVVSCKLTFADVECVVGESQEDQDEVHHLLFMVTAVLSRYEERGNRPSKLVVRDHMLGKKKTLKSTSDTNFVFHFI
ncbi:hypothetical protein RUM44_013559 [Polyplax serrata]|uniref:2-oxoglutarate dehydrogenase, mitochondrial n=1 Tax=Polyplax serrata TaxID=468196 RepID=A0ABR1BI51_POLSC